MDRKRFLATLGALLVAPKVIKASPPVTDVLKTTVPEKQEVTYFVRYKYSYPIDGIPTIDMSLAYAPASTICNYCGRRYDKHAWTGPEKRRISLRNICDAAQSPYAMRVAAENARKMNLGLDY